MQFLSTFYIPNMSKTDKVIDTADKAMDQATRPLMGQAGDPDHAVGHPLHPATVHWPIAVRVLTSLHISELNS